MIEQALQELTRECEHGFASVWESCAARETQFIWPGRSAYEAPTDLGEDETVPVVTRTYTHVKMVNGVTCSEGGELPHAETPVEAMRLFREGFAKYRDEHLGDTLLWRRKPTVEHHSNPLSDEPTGTWVCLARFSIAGDAA